MPVSAVGQIFLYTPPWWEYLLQCAWSIQTALLRTINCTTWVTTSNLQNSVRYTNAKKEGINSQEEFRGLNCSTQCNIYSRVTSNHRRVQIGDHKVSTKKDWPQKAKLGSSRSGNRNHKKALSQAHFTCGIEQQTSCYYQNTQKNCQVNILFWEKNKTTCSRSKFHALSWKWPPSPLGRVMTCLLQYMPNIEHKVEGIVGK